MSPFSWLLVYFLSLFCFLLLGVIWSFFFMYIKDSYEVLLGSSESNGENVTSFMEM